MYTKQTLISISILRIARHSIWDACCICHLHLASNCTIRLVLAFNKILWPQSLQRTGSVLESDNLLEHSAQMYFKVAALAWEAPAAATSRLLGIWKPSRDIPIYARVKLPLVVLFEVQWYCSSSVSVFIQKSVDVRNKLIRVNWKECLWLHTEK